MIELTGWLLDVYAASHGGLSLWLLGEDGRRHHLRQAFAVTFYAAGPARRLRALWQYLRSQPTPVKPARTERWELSTGQALTVLEIRVERAADQPRLFAQVAWAFPDLTFYDADLHITLRHAAVYGSFPLARCQTVIGEDNQVRELAVLDSPWELDPPTPPLRILSLEPDSDPFHTAPTYLKILSSPEATGGKGRGASYRLSLHPIRPLLVNLRAILERHDPDLLLTTWGDTWLLPRLLKLAREWDLPLPLSRDPGFQAAYRREHTYFSYGQIIYRGRQVHLFGRWHVDAKNALLFHDYGLEGVLELARVTSLPVQTVARVSPGSGISAMQMVTALRQGVLVPWHKQQAEELKSAQELLHADQGGLVYAPIIGLHSDVAEVDFISMYPSIMARFNISPETIGSKRLTAENERPGLVPQTLKPLLEKRIALKARLAALPAWDPRRRAYKARSSAHKWLLVTCFGYLGYKNARFGRIEAHEAVTAHGREALLRAKEAAEEQGFLVLHLYVDGLWVKKEGARQVSDFQSLLDEIARRTGLPIALEGIYRWIAFLPSRADKRVPVANRYFGVFQDGSLKVRGIEARRRDTPQFIADTQMAILERLAQAPQAADLASYLPEAVHLTHQRLTALENGQIPLEHLLVSQKLSRQPEEYVCPSPAAQAARQLAATGKIVRPGQRVRFLYTRGKPGVHAWDLPHLPSREQIDVPRYAELLVRSVTTLLEVLGINEAILRSWLENLTLDEPHNGPMYQMSFLPADQPGWRHPHLLQGAKVSISKRTSPPTG